MGSGDLPKQVLYRYNDNSAHDEVEFDLDGTFAGHVEGELVNRRNKQWKVDKLLFTNSRAPTELPILTVFLTDHF